MAVRASRARLAGLIPIMSVCGCQFDETMLVRVRQPDDVDVRNEKTGETLLRAGEGEAAAPVEGHGLPSVVRSGSEGRESIVRETEHRGEIRREPLLANRTIALDLPATQCEGRAYYLCFSSGPKVARGITLTPSAVVARFGDVELATPLSNVESIRRRREPRHVGHHYWVAVDVLAFVGGALVDGYALAARSTPTNRMQPGDRVFLFGIGSTFVASGALWSALHFNDLFGKTTEIELYSARADGH